MDGEDRSGIVILGNQATQDTASLLLEPIIEPLEASRPGLQFQFP